MRVTHFLVELSYVCLVGLTFNFDICNRKTSFKLTLNLLWLWSSVNDFMGVSLQNIIPSERNSLFVLSHEIPDYMLVNISLVV